MGRGRKWEASVWEDTRREAIIVKDIGRSLLQGPMKAFGGGNEKVRPGNG